MEQKTVEYIKFLIKLGLAIGILFACFIYIDINKLKSTLSKAKPDLFLLALLVNVTGTIILPAFLTKSALIIDRINISLRELVSINFSIRFYTLILPRAASIGIRWYRYKQGGSGSDAFALMAFERVVQLLIIATAASLCMWYEFNSLPSESTAIFISIILLTAALAVISSIFMVPSISIHFDRILNKYIHIIPSFISMRLNRLWDAIYAFNSLPKRNSIRIIALSFFAYFFTTVSAYIIALMMNLDISLLALIWVRSIVFIIVLIPITVGGIGLREASFIGLLQLYGIASHEALAFSLMILAIQLSIGFIGSINETWLHIARPLFRK